MKYFLAAVVGAALLACTSVESTVVGTEEIKDIVANGGEPVAVIQASSLGWTFFWHSVTVVESNLDEVVKLLVSEAKAMGANKVDLKSAQTSPRSGFWGLSAILMGMPSSGAVGVAVKSASAGMSAE
ncbi:MAG: hypothetical protein FWC28_09160 [Proteobacteria bacterium]|nr:hypothetical protein [Cystobacterineae bacterium]MCL2258233.1 hypothetical protein [Cystobacterineae bacterium]MCL2315394.1 hypothetical protein [Pseudomonadota bacterium]